MHKKKDNYLPPKVIWVFKNAQLKPSEAELKFNRILCFIPTFFHNNVYIHIFVIINYYVGQGKCLSIIKKSQHAKFNLTTILQQEIKKQLFFNSVEVVLASLRQNIFPYLQSKNVEIF